MFREEACTSMTAQGVRFFLASGEIVAGKTFLARILPSTRAHKTVLCKVSATVEMDS